MPRVEFEALKNSTDDNEWASTAETYLDLMDVYDADDMDDVDISEVKDK
jgi:hypothetical protein